MVHMRIDRRDRGRHCHHGFDGVAAFGKDGTACLNSYRVGRTDSAATMACGVKIDHAAAKPRLRNSASALGRRPRKAL